MNPTEFLTVVAEILRQAPHGDSYSVAEGLTDSDYAADRITHDEISIAFTGYERIYEVATGNHSPCWKCGSGEQEHLIVWNGDGGGGYYHEVHLP